jgi:hypothetical protein
MPEPFLRPRASLSSSRDGWFRRMRENLQQVFASARIFPSSASGAPLHLLPSPPASLANGSRTISLLAHVLLISGVLLLHVELRQPRAGSAGPADSLHPRAFFPLPDPSLFGQPSVGVKGGGGENDPRPARHGDLAPASSRPLLPPRAIVNPLPELPVPASVFDANASPLPPLITRTRREQAPAKAIPTVAPTRTGSPCPFACIVPSAIHRPSTRGQAPRKSHTARSGGRRRPDFAGSNRSARRLGARRTRRRIRTRLEIYSRARRRPPSGRILGHDRSCLPPHLATPVWRRDRLTIVCLIG